jgi:hypothetical protein
LKDRFAHMLLFLSNEIVLVSKEVVGLSILEDPLRVKIKKWTFSILVNLMGKSLAQKIFRDSKKDGHGNFLSLFPALKICDIEKRFALSKYTRKISRYFSLQD